MKKFITILFLTISAAVSATEPGSVILSSDPSHFVNRYMNDDGHMAYVYSKVVASDAVRYVEYVINDAATHYTRYWTNYTWSTSNGNIAITAANYPSIILGDSVKINPKSGGYRSYSLANVGTASNNGDFIVVKWDAAAYITPSVSPIVANSINNCNGVLTDGMTMNDNIDVAFSSYRGSNYSRRMYFKNCSFRGMNGFFPNSNPSGSSLADYTGGSDTTNCYYGWTWDNCRFDSVIGNNKGQTALWFGAIDKKEAWARATIKNCYFGHYRSPTQPESGNPATYFRASNVWGLYIYNNQFEELGMNQPDPVGHAVVGYIFCCYWECYNNFFGTYNFGNCIRNYGGSARLYDQSLISQWSFGYTGRSKLYNNISYLSIKYPFYEENTNVGYTTTLGYCVAMYYAEVVNNTIYRAGTGIGRGPYTTSIIAKAATGTDTVFVKNNVLIGPTDTVWTACNFGGGLNEGCNKFYTLSTGTVSRWDTSNNLFIQNAALAGFDSVKFLPIPGGRMYEKGLSFPYIQKDFSGNSRTQGRATDLGANQYPAGFQLQRCNGCKIKFK
jgi:hypothetical protein